jgi:hypothetical protein
MSGPGFDDLLVRALLLGGGLVTAIRSALGLPRAIASGRWHSVDAQVVDAQVMDAELHSTSTAGQLKVTYRYTVNGQSFTGDRFYASGVPGPRGDVAMVEYYRYRPGQQVVAYYDPQEPGRSALRKEAVWPTIAALAAGIGLIALSFLLPLLVF